MSYILNQRLDNALRKFKVGHRFATITRGLAILCLLLLPLLPILFISFFGFFLIISLIVSLRSKKHVNTVVYELVTNLKITSILDMNAYIPVDLAYSKISQMVNTNLKDYRLSQDLTQVLPKDIQNHVTDEYALDRIEKLLSLVIVKMRKNRLHGKYARLAMIGSVLRNTSYYKKLKEQIFIYYLTSSELSSLDDICSQMNEPHRPKLFTLKATPSKVESVFNQLIQKKGYSNYAIKDGKIEYFNHDQHSSDQYRIILDQIEQGQFHEASVLLKALLSHYKNTSRYYELLFCIKYEKRSIESLKLEDPSFEVAKRLIQDQTFNQIVYDSQNDDLKQYKNNLIEIIREMRSLAFQAWIKKNRPGIILSIVIIVISFLLNQSYQLVVQTIKSTPIEITYPIEGITVPGLDNDIRFEDLPYELPEAVKTGHTFAGWYTNEAFKGEPIKVIKASFDTKHTLYPKFTPNTYYIKIHDSNNEPIKQIPFEYNQSITLTPLERDGFTQAGWYFDLNLFRSFNLTTMPAYHVTLYVKWTINEYDIIYDYGYDDMNQTIAHDYGQRFETVVPTRDGYTFLGWYQEPSYETALDSTDKVNQNTTLYAKWAVNSYSVSFIDYDDQIVKTESINYDTSLLSYEVPQNLQRDGYTFIGWDNNLPNKMPNQDLVFNALYNINTYIIDFNTNSEDSIDTVSVEYNNLITLPNNPIKKGYTFDGWYIDAGLNTRFTLEHMPSENLSLYAKWVINQYDVIFIDADESTIIIQTFDFNTNLIDHLILPNNPTKTGYTFIGWDKELPTYLDDDDIILKAIYTINQYDIVYEVNGGSVVMDATYDYNQALLLPIPTKPNYHFMGWYMDESLQTPLDVMNMPDNDLTLYARWFIKTIEFGSSSVDHVMASIIDHEHYIITVGYTYDTLNSNIIPKGESDAFIIKQNLDGQVIWVKSFGGTNMDMFSAITVDDSGNYIVVGSSYSRDLDFSFITDNYPPKSFIMKINPEGVILWQTVLNFGTYSGYMNAITMDQNGDFVLVGSTKNALYAGIDDESIIIKVHSLGNILWSKTIDVINQGNDYFKDIEIDSNNDYVVIGNTFNTGYTGVLFKFDSDGDVIWETMMYEYYGNKYESIAIDSSDNYYIVGEARVSTISIYDIENGYTNAIISKYDSSGHKLWGRLFGGSGEESFTSVSILENGDLVVIGHTNSNDYDFLRETSGYLSMAVIIKPDLSFNIVYDSLYTSNNQSIVYQENIVFVSGSIYMGDGKEYDCRIWTII